jgi:hypothetical protein
MPRSSLERAANVDTAVCLRRWKIQYTVWMAVMPTIVFVAVFGALCAYECTAAPWFTLLLAPVLAAFIGIGLLITYWGRATKLGDEHGRALRRFVMWSVLWGPLLAAATFSVALSAMQNVVTLFN